MVLAHAQTKKTRSLFSLSRCKPPVAGPRSGPDTRRKPCGTTWTRDPASRGSRTAAACGTAPELLADDDTHQSIGAGKALGCDATRAHLDWRLEQVRRRALRLRRVRCHPRFHRELQRPGRERGHFTWQLRRQPSANDSGHATRASASSSRAPTLNGSKARPFSRWTFLAINHRSAKPRS